MIRNYLIFWLCTISWKNNFLLVMLIAYSILFHSSITLKIKYTIVTSIKYSKVLITVCIFMQDKVFHVRSTLYCHTSLWCNLVPNKETIIIRFIIICKIFGNGIFLSRASSLCYFFKFLQKKPNKLSSIINNMFTTINSVLDRSIYTPHWKYFLKERSISTSIMSMLCKLCLTQVGILLT